jgi:uncharacterized protein (DUF433 family)
MTIKWVKVDPLVMNGEPFCYGTRLTVRNILEMRSNGLTPTDMLGQFPELRSVGIAEAFRYAGDNRSRYGDFFETNGTLRGSGFPADDAVRLPEHLRGLTGVVVS